MASFTSGNITQESWRFAYGAAVGSSRVVVADGIEGKQYDDAERIIFSPDGRHLAYIGTSGGKTFMVLDGVEGKQYDDIVTRGGSRIIFNSSDSWHYLALKGNDVYLVEENIE